LNRRESGPGGLSFAGFAAVEDKVASGYRVAASPPRKTVLRVEFMYALARIS